MDDVLIGADPAPQFQLEREDDLNQATKVDQKVNITMLDQEAELDAKVREVFNVKMSVFYKREDGKVKCKECKYTSVRIGNVRKHWKEVHNESITVFKCQECDFQTKSKYHLKAHITAKHQGIRYDCNFCDFQTAYTKALRRHTETKHNNGESPFKCDQCDFQAGFNKKDLRKHVRENHIPELKEEDEK